MTVNELIRCLNVLSAEGRGHNTVYVSVLVAAGGDVWTEDEMVTDAHGTEFPAAVRLDLGRWKS